MHFQLMVSKHQNHVCVCVCVFTFWVFFVLYYYICFFTDFFKCVCVYIYNILSSILGIYFLIIYLFIFIVISPTHFFPLYNMGTQLHIYLYILFSPIVMLLCKSLDLVLSAIQQDLIVHPFQMQYFASVNPKLKSIPLPSPPPRQLQVYFPSPQFSFL